MRQGALRKFDPQTGRFTSQNPVLGGQEHLSLYQYGWNNPILKPDPDGLEPCCGDLMAFTTGFKDAIIEDNSPIGLNLIKSSEKGSSYSKGVTAGHLGAIFLSIGETLGGIGGDAIAAIGTLASGGTATPATVPVAVASTGAIVHGTATMAKAVVNLNSEGKHPNSNSSSGNNGAAQRGKIAHRELAEKVKNKEGWKSEPSLKGKDGKTYKPDVETPSGNILEYKPNTPRGRSRGKSQLKKYEEQTGRKGRVIYYEP